MLIKQFYKENVEIIYYEDYTKVTNSYLLTNKEIEEVAEEIEFSRYNKFNWRCKHLRHKVSYIEEIKAHNRLYKWNYKRDHTACTDLEEEIDIVHKFLYWLLGR